MKKLSKVLAVVLCMALVLSMMVMGVSAEETAVEFTVDSLGLKSNSYGANTATIDGIDVEWIQLGNYGNGIQMRDKDGKTSMFWNTEAFPGGITKIELTFNSAKNTYNNPDAVIFNFGTSMKGADYSTKLSTVAGEKTYTITPDASNYTYFYLEHDLGYTFYWDSIKVYYGGSAAPDVPDVPDVPDIPVEPDEPELTLSDISTALAGADGEQFMVKGVVTCVDSSNIYVQDATGAICVRMAEKPTDIALGDTIIGTGTKAVYNGMPQLGSGTYEKSEGYELVAKEATIDSLTTADICTYVKLSGLTVVEVFDKDGTYTTPNITLTDGTNEIQIYKAVIDKNEDGTWSLAVGDVVDVQAGLGCYKTTLQLRNTLASEITKVEQSSGYTVSGTITSYGEGEAVVELLSEGAVVYTAACVDGAYSISDIAAGAYTLRVSKDNHIAVELELTVEADAVVDAKICLKGDVTGDGKLNMKDWIKIYDHISETAELTDYAWDCADVTDDGKVNMKDWIRVYEHLSETNPLW